MLNDIEETSSRSLELIESHKQIIERDSEHISAAWKVIPMCLHFVCAICGYGCANLFYIFWTDIFGHNCPIWAKLEPPMHFRTLREMGSQVIEEEGPEIVTDDWRKKLIITFKHQFHCEFFFFITLCSCSFGVIWLTLFWRCGKGGYDTRIFTSPWTLVPPALLFHLIFAPIVISVVHDMIYGYWNFTKNLKKAAITYMNQTEIVKIKKHCEIVRHYLDIYDINSYNVCYVYTAIEILSWTMAWSWLMILGILCMRVFTATDFRLLVTKIYKIPPRPPTPPKRRSTEEIIEEPEESVVRRQRIKKVIFTLPEREKYTQ